MDDEDFAGRAVKNFRKAAWAARRCFHLECLCGGLSRCLLEEESSGGGRTEPADHGEGRLEVRALIITHRTVGCQAGLARGAERKLGDRLRTGVMISAIGRSDWQGWKGWNVRAVSRCGCCCGSRCVRGEGNGLRALLKSGKCVNRVGGRRPFMREFHTAPDRLFVVVNIVLQLCRCATSKEIR